MNKGEDCCVLLTAELGTYAYLVELVYVLVQTKRLELALHAGRRQRRWKRRRRRRRKGVNWLCHSQFRHNVNQVGIHITIQPSTLAKRERTDCLGWGCYLCLAMEHRLYSSWALRTHPDHLKFDSRILTSFLLHAHVCVYAQFKNLNSGLLQRSCNIEEV